MKLKFKVIAIILLGLACTKKSDKDSEWRLTAGSDSLVYGLVHQVLTDTSMYGKEAHRILSEEPMLPPPVNYNSSYASYVSKALSEEDTLCIVAQLRESHFSVSKMKVYGFTIVNVDSFRVKFASKGAFWDRFYERYGDGFLSVSKPIFNCDRTKAFVRVAYMCENECGGGSDLILERSGDSWVLNEEISSWVS